MKTAMAALLALALLSGCASSRVPVENLRGAPVMARHALTLDQVAAAIARAGVRLGWQMRRVDAHDMAAVLRLYRARAVIRIHFTTHTYDLSYGSSQHLHAKGGEIERRYNQWIHSLVREIGRQTACAGGPRPCQSLVPASL